MLTWITFAAVQVVVLVMGGAVLLRAVQGRRVAGLPILAGAGALLVLLNAAWFWTDGPAGGSLIPMRGGAAGAWLSLLTGIEIALIGVVALVLTRRT